MMPIYFVATGWLLASCAKNAVTAESSAFTSSDRDTIKNPCTDLSKRANRVRGWWTHLKRRHADLAVADLIRYAFAYYGVVDELRR